MIFLLDGQTQKTMLAYYMDGDFDKVYPPYEGRVSIDKHSQQEASFRFQNVTKEDTGKYVLKLAGPGSQSIVEMKVFDNKL